MTYGPYETPEQARAAARPIYDAHHQPGGMTGAALRMLIATCHAAGVELGAEDRKHLEWVASAGDVETAVVVAGLIRRAHDTGRQEGGASS